ncbi:Uncharacterised protein [Propionibacterium australiense]|uniref:Arc-type ribbon-helix-helix n=1 Tax=Propionibacterium australiense TaxID=119981 RepID=A0A383S8D0_9ACTN|nr:Arc-type ribbon-helix-helix [Propionibacterium australiense]VEH89920.1 Uncharacterised protein [Propionibacterium australiense]
MVVPVRLDTDTIGALMTRAEADGLATCPDAIRAAVREWLRGG